MAGQTYQTYAGTTGQVLYDTQGTAKLMEVQQASPSMIHKILQDIAGQVLSDTQGNARLND